MKLVIHVFIRLLLFGLVQSVVHAHAPMFDLKIGSSVLDAENALGAKLTMNPSGSYSAEIEYSGWQVYATILAVDGKLTSWRCSFHSTSSGDNAVNLFSKLRGDLVSISRKPLRIAIRLDGEWLLEGKYMDLGEAQSQVVIQGDYDTSTLRLSISASCANELIADGEVRLSAFRNPLGIPE